MADFTVTETGGNPMQAPGGRRLGVAVLEKGMVWCTVTVHGTPGHGSRPYRSDNALAKAAKVVERLAALKADAQIVPAWRTFVEEMGLPAGFADPALVASEIDKLEDAGEATRVHACTHTTFSPNVVRGGDKTNVIPDRVEVDVDVRTMPGQDAVTVRHLILEALGPLAGDVSINVFHQQSSNASPTGTPLWEVLDEVAAGLTGGARLVPTVMTGCTDARFWRDRGAVVYGFGLFSDAVTLDEHEAMFHGRNERVDLESLRLSAELWDGLARRFSEVSR
jgi:acetylornithine deacetylase/succinyl-diaminopimelate desuccinylase-like protein